MASRDEALSLRAPGFGFRGSPSAFLLLVAVAGPVASAGLVLWMMPRFSGADEIRELRKEVAVLRDEQRELHRTLDLAVATMNRENQGLRNELAIMAAARRP